MISIACEPSRNSPGNSCLGNYCLGGDSLGGVSLDRNAKPPRDTPNGNSPSVDPEASNPFTLDPKSQELIITITTFAPSFTICPLLSEDIDYTLEKTNG